MPISTFVSFFLLHPISSHCSYSPIPTFTLYFLFLNSQQLYQYRYICSCYKFRSELYMLVPLSWYQITHKTFSTTSAWKFLPWFACILSGASLHTFHSFIGSFANVTNNWFLVGMDFHNFVYASVKTNTDSYYWFCPSIPWWPHLSWYSFNISFLNFLDKTNTSIYWCISIRVYLYPLLYNISFFNVYPSLPFPNATSSIILRT